MVGNSVDVLDGVFAVIVPDNIVQSCALSFETKHLVMQLGLWKVGQDICHESSDIIGVRGAEFLIACADEMDFSSIDVEHPRQKCGE